MKKGVLNMNGLSVFGVCIIVVSILTIIWGMTLYPVNFLDSKFMSFVTGGVILATVGVFMISGMPVPIKIISILISTLALMVYIYGFKDMDLIIKLISFVPIAGLAIWLIMKTLK